MTKEEKELFLKDLCARLPYGVKVQYMNKIFDIDYISPIYGEVKLDTSGNWTIGISEVKPYLFPLSSMTEEQKKECPIEPSIRDAFINGEIYLSEDEGLTVYEIIEIFDWLNANHFDYRGLIEKELAIDATELNIY